MTGTIPLDFPRIIPLERGDQGESVVSSQNWRISEASRVMGLLRKASRDDACTTTRKVFTSTPCSRYSKMVWGRSCSMDFNWPSGPAWAAFFLLFIMAMIEQAPPPARCCFFHLTISEWATRSSSAAFRRVIPFSCCRRSAAVRRPSLRCAV